MPELTGISMLIALLGIVILSILLILAPLKLFSIDRTLKKILKELQKRN